MEGLVYLWFGLGLLLGIMLGAVVKMCRSALVEDSDSVPLKEVPIEDVKMILVVRKDLKMGVGKIGAQCGHATLGAYKFELEANDYWGECVSTWERVGQKKICV